MNEQNLRPFTSDQDREKARENGRKGGKASGEARRKRKSMSEAFQLLLGKQFIDRNGNEMDGMTALVARVYKEALEGDVQAAKFIRDTIGEVPVQKVEATTVISQETYERVAAILAGEK